MFYKTEEYKYLEFFRLRIEVYSFGEMSSWIEGVVKEGPEASDFSRW